MFQTIICFIKTVGGYEVHGDYTPLEGCTMRVVGVLRQETSGSQKYVSQFDTFHFEHHGRVSRDKIASAFELFWNDFWEMIALQRIPLSLIAHNPQHVKSVLQQHGVDTTAFTLISAVPWFKKMRNMEKHKYTINELARGYSMPGATHRSFHDLKLLMRLHQYAYVDWLTGRSKTISELSQRITEKGPEAIWADIFCSKEYLTLLSPNINVVTEADWDSLTLEETKLKTKIRDFEKRGDRIFVTTRDGVEYTTSVDIFLPQAQAQKFVMQVLSHRDPGCKAYTVVENDVLKTKIIQAILDRYRRENKY